MFVPLPVNANAMVEEELMAVPDRADRTTKIADRVQGLSPGLVIHTGGIQGRQRPRGSRYERLDGVPHCLRRVYRALSHLSCPGFVNRYLLVPFFRDPVTNADQFAGVDSSPESASDFPLARRV